MFRLSANLTVYLRRDAIDFRKSIKDAIQTDVPLATVLNQDERVVMTDSMNFPHQSESDPPSRLTRMVRAVLLPSLPDRRKGPDEQA